MIHIRPRRARLSRTIDYQVYDVFLSMMSSGAGYGDHHHDAFGPVVEASAVVPGYPDGATMSALCNMAYHPGNILYPLVGTHPHTLVRRPPLPFDGISSQTAG